MTEKLRSWEESFQALVQYKKEHGDCLVPKSWEGDTRLASWVSAQRTSRTRTKLTKHQLEKLEGIGFSYDAAKEINDQKWNEKFELLKKYRAIHGDCLVSRGNKEYPALAIWVKEQRHAKTRNTLSKARERKLQSIGFCFRLLAYSERDIPQLDRNWLLKYEELLKFKRQCGHCNVPARTTALGAWVARQRQEFRIGHMRNDRKELLEEVGFCWKVTTKEKAAPVTVVPSVEITETSHEASGPSNLKIGTKGRKQVPNAELHGVVSRRGSDNGWPVDYANGDVGGKDLDNSDTMRDEHAEASGEPSYTQQESRNFDRSSNVASLDQQYVGMQVRKASDIGWLDGVVTRKTKKGNWRVQYADGSKEFVSKEELQDLMDAYEENSSTHQVGEEKAEDIECEDGEKKMAANTTMDYRIPRKPKPPTESGENREWRASLPSISEASPSANDDEQGQVPRNEKTRAKSDEIVPEQCASLLSISEPSPTATNDVVNEHALEDEIPDDAYAKLSPLFFELCKTINASRKGRKRLPQYEAILSRWISKEREKGSRPNKRHKTSNNAD